WVISWRDRVRYFDDDLAERSSFLLEAPGPLALAPLGTGAMYVQQCPSDSALLCRGTLAVAPSRSQRRAAH
ncbi:MAG TPA: hypothetical protein VJ032_02835, partial [Thermoanaerobaculia bacterium]|nr:hypothetical protein [Thermoanaerobaculia bacterium]